MESAYYFQGIEFGNFTFDAFSYQAKIQVCHFKIKALKHFLYDGACFKRKVSSGNFQGNDAMP